MFAARRQERAPRSPTASTDGASGGSNLDAQLFVGLVFDFSERVRRRLCGGHPLVVRRPTCFHLEHTSVSATALAHEANAVQEQSELRRATAAQSRSNFPEDL
jgi:hypothetical protein